MIIQKIKTFIYGIVSSVDEDTAPRGAAVDSLNWLTEGDKIELRRGSRILGVENMGAGRATGIIKVVDASKTDQLFGSYMKKLVHFNRTTEVFDEIGSDILGDAVIQEDGYGEDISLAEYTGLAGNQLWVNSPNISGLYKIMVANPLNAVNQYDATKNYKGHISIDTNRMFLWARNEDQTGIYGSYIDSLAFTTVTAEVLGTGDAVEDTFAGTLAFKGGDAKRTCFAVEVTDGVETFSDDSNGVLTGNLGGTGTINYATGAISVTFNTPPGNLTNVVVDYQWENSTNTGIADFTESAPRTAGQGFVFRQDEGGGEVKTIKNYKNIYYCFHAKKTWTLNLSSDDTNAENLPFRTAVGIPNLNAAVETEDGIFYIEDVTSNDPAIKRLSYDSGGNEEVLPVDTSEKIDLKPFLFDRSFGFRYGIYVIFTCRTTNSTVNNRMLVYNRRFDSWDMLDYLSNGLAEYDGALISADSISSNFTELFSGEDDDESEIPNYWIGDLDDHEIEGLKKTKKWYQRGEIGPDQEIEIYHSYDDGNFIYIGSIVGDGEYVDTSQSVNVGSLTLGRGELGGGGDGRVAYTYERLFKIRTSKYERVKVKFVAKKIGYASVAEYGYWDIRFKGQKVPRKYRG